MERSIVFSPDTDDRQLDKEVSKIDDKLGEVDETITPQVDTSAMDGVGSGVSGGRGGRGGGGVGQAAGVGALASKIPKPIGAVAAGAAIPTAMVGSIGVGLLSAMHGASARMQTSTQLLGQAWNNVWRPLGDRVDELFIRGPVMDIVDATQSFEELLRASFGADAAGNMVEAWEQRLRGMASLADLLPGTFGDVLSGGLEGAADAIQVLQDFEWTGLPEFNWPDLPSFSWPSLPNFQWPDIPTPDVSFDVGTSIDIQGTVEDLLGGDLSVDAFVDSAQAELQSRFDGNGGGDRTDADPGSPHGGRSEHNIPGMATGGRVQDSGVARVHKGEMVGDTDKLVSELADAIGEAGGGGGGGAEVDTSQVEQKLDEVNRNLKRLADAIPAFETVSDGELARVASNGQQNRVADRNPLI